MKNKVRRTITMMLIAVILFSASMSIPALQHSKVKDFMQGGALGLMIGAIIIIISSLIDHYKEGKAAK